MHTEHLQNVRAVWVASGWLVAIAVTSLLVLVAASLELIGRDNPIEGLWIVLAVAVGFWGGGFSIGFRALEAPILHGIGIGLATLLAWFLLNLLAGVTLRRADWQALTPALSAGLLLLQMAAAIGGAWVGHNIALARAGQPEEPPTFH